MLLTELPGLDMSQGLRLIKNTLSVDMSALYVVKFCSRKPTEQSGIGKEKEQEENEEEEEEEKEEEEDFPMNMSMVDHTIHAIISFSFTARLTYSAI